MAEINKINMSQLIEAIKVWTHWGKSAMPKRDDKRLVEVFGRESSAMLLPVIKSLEDDFYTSDARLVASDLRAMEKLASEEFKRKHPELPDEIIMIFAWCYTFDFK